jgi:hypothetical protein
LLAFGFFVGFYLDNIVDVLEPLFIKKKEETAEQQNDEE